jgi:hypothetical protein
MTQTQLTGFEAAAMRGAELLDDDALAEQLVELANRALAVHTDGHTAIQDLRELAAAATVTARRLEAR